MTIGGRSNAPPAAPGGESDAIDLRALFLTLWRRKLVILGTALIVTGTAVLVVMQMVPRYVAEARIVVEPPRTNVVDIESVAQSLSTDWLTNQTQAAIIGSRVLAAKVVERLDLADDPMFNPALRPPKKGAVEKLGLDRFVPDSWLAALGVLGPERRAAAPPAAGARGEVIEESIINAYLGGLDIVPSEMSRVITVRYTSTDPEVAARLANAAAQTYIDDQISGKFEQTEQANAWLQERAVELKQAVEESARAVEEHRRRSGLVNVEGSTLLAQQLAELNSRLIVARAERAEAEARYDQVQSLLASEGGVESAAAVLESGLIQRLREQEAQVVRKIAELKTQLRDAHPKMILARTELAELQDKIESEVRKIITNLNSELKIARVREANLSQEVAELRQKLDSQTDAEITLRALETELEANQKLYDTILARLKETNVQETSPVQPDARVISFATVPNAPAYPRKRMIVATSFAGSLVIGVLLVLLLEHLDSGFRTRSQVEAVTGVTALGLVPRHRGLGTVPVYDAILESPHSILGESFRTLRTALALSSVDEPPRTVLITSALPGEGKSTTAVALARTAAKAGQKCLIIDCDMRHPRLHEAFGVPNDLGLMDYLSDEAALEDVVHVDFKSGAHFILAGRNIPHAADLVGSEKMRRLLTALKKAYDFIVIDTPPVLALSDTMVLLRHVDKAVFLVRWEKTRREAAAAGLRQVLDAGADLAGVVLTQVDVRRQAQYDYSETPYYHYYDDEHRKYSGA